MITLGLVQLCTVVTSREIPLSILTLIYSYFGCKIVDIAREIFIKINKMQLQLPYSWIPFIQSNAQNIWVSSVVELQDFGEILGTSQGFK